MKCEVKDVTLIVPIVGDGGYNNRSGLALHVRSLGWIELADPWDLSSISTLEIQEWELTIPSGSLVSRGGVTTIVDFDQLLLQAEDCQWDGKQAGLFGGMSGYGSFYFSSIDRVQGTFLLPKDGRGLTAGEPVEFISHHTDWTTYSLRMAAMKSETTGLGWDKTHAMAAMASEALKLPRLERTQAQSELLEDWWKSISEAVESYVPELY